MAIVKTENNIKPKEEKVEIVGLKVEKKVKGKSYLEEGKAYKVSKDVADLLIKKKIAELKK